MGLIRAAMGAIGGNLGDQWKEFFYCDSLPADVLIRKGQKRTSSQGRSSNTSGEDNVISNGSRIAVNAGQCMIIVENGKVVDFCAEPGEFTYDTSLAPSLFTGNDLKESVIETFKDIGKRFTFGGDPGRDQRVYYFNMKEILGNKFGTPAPVQFRVFEEELNRTFMFNLRCFGQYSYKISDPVLFYSKIAGNVTDEYKREEIDGQLKTELQEALQGALGRLSALRIPYDQIVVHNKEMTKAMNEELSEEWGRGRGIEVVNVALASVTADEKSRQRYDDAMDAAIYSNPMMGAGLDARGRTDAMRTAAGNEGTIGGFMGIGLAGGMSGAMNNSAMMQQQMQQQMQMQQMQQQMQQMMQQQQMGAQPGMQQPGMGMAAGVPQQPQAPAAPAGWTCGCGHTGNTGKFCGNCGQPKPEPKPAADAWNCACGHTGNTGKFCAECGQPKPVAPAAPEGWTCTCGQVNQGKFCPNCGGKKPADAPLYKCDKCGWVPPDPKNPPKFCPECGDLFDENDAQ